MALKVDGDLDRRMGVEKSLGRGLGFEQLLLAFSSSDRQVGVLNAVLLPKSAGSMKVTQTQLVERRTAGQQAICGDRLRVHPLVFREMSEQPQRRHAHDPSAEDHLAVLASLL